MYDGRRYADHAVYGLLRDEWSSRVTDRAEPFA
jgi:hypothetical protein